MGTLKYREAHRKELVEKAKLYVQTHKTQVAEYQKRYRAEHKEQQRAYIKKWKQQNPERKRELNRKWAKANPEKVNAASKRWYKTTNGKLHDHSKHAKAKAYRKAKGFSPINQVFTNSHAHHIDKETVIYIPKEMHTNIKHNLNTGLNMGKINKLALSWLKQQ